MRRKLDHLLVIAGFVTIWALAHQMLGGFVLSSPLQTVTNAAGLLASATFWPHVWATGSAFLLAVLIAWSAGLLIGALLGLHRSAGDVADPMVGALYAIPKITLYPVILLFFGLGLSAKVAFGAIHGIFPVIIFTMSGMRAINPSFLKISRALNLTRAATLSTIMLPAALPDIMSGLRVGFAAAVLGTLIGEMFASSAGLGYILMRNISNNDIPMVMALILLVFLFAIAANSALLWLERRVL